MPDSNFYHVLIEPKDGVSNAQVEGKMNLALNWYRVNYNWWLLFTTSDAAKWRARLKPLVEPSGSLFICRVDMTERDGWMTKDFWQWIKKCKTGGD